MARLIVASITASGFVRYSEDNPGTLLLGGRGPVGITGENGAGKSSIASKALSWCFYGKCSPETMGASTRMLKGKSVVADGCKKATVSIALEYEDGSGGWVIERSRTKTKADTIVVQVVDADGNRSEVDRSPEDILGVDHAIFCATVLRGQGDPWNFAQATDAKKREILAAVSGAARLAEPYKRARGLALQLTSEAQGFHARAADAQHRADRIPIADMERQKADWGVQQDRRILAAEAEVKALETAEEAAKAADRAATTSAHDRRKHADQRPTLDLTPYDRAAGDASAVVRTATADHASGEALLRATDGLEPGATCPTCGQGIAEDAPVAQRRAAALKPLEAAQRALDAALVDQKTARDAQTVARAWLANEIREWEGARPAPVQGGNLPGAQTATGIARRRLDDLKSGDNPHVTVLVRAMQDMTEYVREALRLETLAQHAENDHAHALTLCYALSPKGAAAHMADEVLTTIEVHANHWLGTLSGGTMSVEFVVSESESITTKVHTTDSPSGPQTRDLLQYSGGERARVNLAVDLGVAAAFSAGDGLALSCLVLDESTFSGVDDKGKAAIVRALNDAGVADIIVIDHDPAARGRLDREVQIVRGHGGYATIQEAP